MTATRLTVVVETRYKRRLPGWLWIPVLWLGYRLCPTWLFLRLLFLDLRIETRVVRADGNACEWVAMRRPTVWEWRAGGARHDD